MIDYIKPKNVSSSTDLSFEIKDYVSFIKNDISSIKKMLKDTERDLESVKANIFTRLFFGGVKVKNGNIIIKRINFYRLLKQIDEAYSSNNLKKMFDIIYNTFDLREYKKKRLKTKSEMRITSFVVKEFFAIELYTMLIELYKKYNIKSHLYLAADIREKTYLSNIQTMSIEKESVSSEFNEIFKYNPLLDHQIEFIQYYNSLKKILGLRGLVLSFDQGLGKTITSLALSVLLKKTQIVIVCLKTMTTIWADEIMDKMSNMRDNPENKKDIFVFGDKMSNYGTYTKGAKFLIVNNESVKSIRDHVDFNKNTLFIIDECQNFRNPEGVRWESVYSMITELWKNGKTLDVLPMSGTPIKAKPSEIVPSMMCIDPLFDMEAAKIYSKCFDIDTIEASNIIGKRFSRIIYRKTKEETNLNLPKKNILDLRLTIKDPSEYMMDKVKDDVVAAYTKHYTTQFENILPFKKRYEELVNKYCSRSCPASLRKQYLNYLNNTIIKKNEVYVHELTLEEFMNFGKKYIRPNIISKEDLEEFNLCELRYVRISNSAMGKAVGEIYPPRISSMYINILKENSEQIAQIIDEGIKKTCLFSTRIEIVNAMHNFCTENNYKDIVITGKNPKERGTLINTFRNDETVEVLVAMSQTMGTGTTLLEANQEIIFGPPWRKADFDQLSDRIHRYGQKTECFIYIVKLVTEKKNLSDRLIEIMTWSDQMVNSYVNEIDGIVQSTESYFDLSIPIEDPLLTLFSLMQ